MESSDPREDTDPEELRNIMIIYEHAFYFRAICKAKSIRGGAKLLSVTPRNVFSHIQWMQCLTGEKLLQDVLPGQPMRLSDFGNELWGDMKQDFENAVKKLNKNKMDGVVDRSFTDVIKEPYFTYKFQKNKVPKSSSQTSQE